ncbi:MAG: hypothetical protein BZY83_02005 [SAR202 cluster bacterium Casp-Chloro-G2]|nr:MAG: hypothetical protein BZY83_02005 [SAR202 cluster bacterium Casp-Chloro-G2]
MPAQPTPHPGATDWVKARVDAVVALYQPTDDGEALLRSLDLRQMKGEPGFFGSYGFDDWAGVGEAKPIGVIHELGHSYWGGFPVEGRPDLDWKKPPTAGLSSAMESYHRDILTFMSQPPDGFELLRQRLRNLPDVSSKNTEPVFHHLEADLVYTTGGSLDLVPPILRKYWVDFLSPGRWGDWYGAAGWFQSLTQDERSDTGRWLGFEHFDLRLYPSLAPSYPPDGLLPAANRVLETEEKQRLFDLADQFDLLIGDPRNEENFQSWRGYLQDKVRLQRSYPAYLSSLGRPDTGRLASALGFLAAQPVGTVAEQADRLAARLAEEPFLVNFLPAVDNRVLVELFFSGAALPEGRTLQATASFVERLRVFGAKVESVLQAGRDDAGRGAAELERFLTETGFDQKEDVRLFFDLFRDRDPDTADAVTFALADDTVRRLMTLVPFQLRTILSPEDLLTKLGVTLSTDDLADLKAGITLLVEEASGNFRVDEPFLEALFQVAAARAGIAPRETAQLLLDSPVPLEGMLLAQPAAGALILNSDMDTALTLVRDSDPLLSPPWRVMYRLINADPGLAARLLAEFQRRGEGALVAESLAYFAYDKDRLARSSILPISLEEDGRLLSALFRVEGADWLEARLGESVELYRQRVESGEVSPDFLERYRETLEFAAAFLSGGESRTAVTGIIRRAFGLS